jgi:hypothetical protein
MGVICLALQLVGQRASHMLLVLRYTTGAKPARPSLGRRRVRDFARTIR